MYLHEREHWWKFTYDSDKVMTELGKVRAKQGLMLGRMSSLGFDFQEDAYKQVYPCRYCYTI